MVCKLRVQRVIVSEIDEDRRNIAKEIGADITFNPSKENLVEEVRNLTEGRGADVVFNTTPIASVAEQAVNIVAPSGRVVMYSSIHPTSQ